MKAWFGDAAAEENGWGFDLLPRMTGDHSHMTTVADMADGKVKGYFAMGENPVAGSMNGPLERKGLRQLDWLVVRDFSLTETADFWRRAPEIERGDVRPEEIATEVFFFPCAAHTEKDGSSTNTQRLLQWHHKAIDPPGDCRSDLDFVFHLGRRLKKLYAGSQEKKDRAVRDLTWNYRTVGERQEVDAESVLAEISGRTVADGKPVSRFTELKDDGSTACGCWMYAGCYENGENQAARRKLASLQSWVAPEWGWAWPANRRLLYNRASADPEGRPWSKRKQYVWWDEAKQQWTGYDNPDCIQDRPPSYRPPEGARGLDTISGADPFIMNADGKGWLFAPKGLKEHEASRVTQVGKPLSHGAAGMLWTTAKVLTAASLVASVLPGQSRGKRRLSGILGALGSLCLRFAVFQAGQVSSRDPHATFRQQRAGHGAAEVTGEPAETCAERKPVPSPKTKEEIWGAGVGAFGSASEQE
jgi:formate dehydrogenase major subunit